MTAYEYGNSVSGVTFDEALRAADESKTVIEKHWDNLGVWTTPIELRQYGHVWGWYGVYTLLIPDSTAALFDAS